MPRCNSACRFRSMNGYGTSGSGLARERYGLRGMGQDELPKGMDAGSNREQN